MKLLVLNPNTTAAMTAQVVAEVRRLAAAAGRADAEVRGVTAAQGCEVIASRQSFVIGAWAALETWGAHDDGWADAVLLACFGDPGLAALREAAQVPVLGMAESALAEAVAQSRPYRIVTAGAAWGPMLRETARVLQAEHLLDGITLLDTTGLAVSREPARFAALVQAELDGIAAAAAAAGGAAPTCILAGAGFAGMLPSLRYPGLLIDGVGAAWRGAHRVATDYPASGD